MIVIHVISVMVLCVTCLVCGREKIERIKQCGHQCAPGLECTVKAVSEIGLCRRLPTSFSNPLKSADISTVMKCDRERHCSLYLKVVASVELNDKLRGVEMCTVSSHTSKQQCTAIKFRNTLGGNHQDRQVYVQFNCFEVGVAQRLLVTIRTLPDYCGTALFQEYAVQDCQNADIRRNVPICIAGKLNYAVDEKRKLLSVQVSEFLEDYDYHLRLCHKWYSCESTGSYVKIDREDLVNNVSLSYSRLLPCLCIEGWSSIPDASRMQLCPFKNYTEELWNGITYNSEHRQLLWELKCPVDVSVNLCWQTEQRNSCVDLSNSSQKVYKVVQYSDVEPHPRLCMKFTTGISSSIRCPFAIRHDKVWNMNLNSASDQQSLIISSQINAMISLTLCNMSTFSTGLCSPIGDELTMLHIGSSEQIIVNLPKEACHPNICVQGRRTDVKYSIPVLKCGLQCPFKNDKMTIFWILTVSLVVLSLLIVATLMGHVLLTVFHQRKGHILNKQEKIQLFKPNTVYF
ncbi:putative interleukin-17 receptor E-like [Erpetoichthys calabaricus]|uniref:Interleukin-17 receptor C/E N-terminal domain-containing protein n=1 Tax=Erpetoichthys calabaricus TaxID=27687 RepID=A0A8C4X5L4_ERPCA|nr:putative interleukin-17 receptor E-like [Erpetoichthys calabaricus]